MSAEGLVLPETLNGYLYLESLTSTEGLVLPEILNGDLYLNGLLSAEGLVLPKTINGDLYLESLTSAEGLVLPKTINGDLDLISLKTINGLKLPANYDLNKVVFSKLFDSLEMSTIHHMFLYEIRNNPEKYFRTPEEENQLFHNEEGDEFQSNTLADETIRRNR